MPGVGFQSTHPYRVWLSFFDGIQRYIMFQSTHPYRVWLVVDAEDGIVIIVSIHTPIQGVTRGGNLQDTELQFQSTHPYRVWLPCTFSSTPSAVFQSTHPYRVWPLMVSFAWLLHPFQSTHPYRVWRLFHSSRTDQKCFNPHTHTGCDAYDDGDAVIFKVSIHTPIQGVTSGGSVNIDWGDGFNPHTHTGCDIHDRAAG